jgi:hypothetical protein
MSVKLDFTLFVTLIRMRVSENKVMRNICGPEREREKLAEEKNYTTKNFVLCTLHIVLL